MAEWLEDLQNGEPQFEEEWDIVYSCSNCCGSVIGNYYNYCPWCGEKITRTPKERGGDK